MISKNNKNDMKLYVVAHIDNHGNSTNPLFNELAICSSTNVTAMGLADKSADPKTGVCKIKVAKTYTYNNRN